MNNLTRHNKTSRNVKNNIFKKILNVARFLFARYKCIATIKAFAAFFHPQLCLLKATMLAACVCYSEKFFCLCALNPTRTKSSASEKNFTPQKKIGSERV